MDIDGKMARLNPDDQELTGVKCETIPVKYINAVLPTLIKQVNERIHVLGGLFKADSEELIIGEMGQIVRQYTELQRRRQRFEEMAAQILYAEIETIR